jgi:hypothetical protein
MSLKFINQQQSMIQSEITRNDPTLLNWTNLMTVIDSEHMVLLCKKYLELVKIDNNYINECQIKKFNFYIKVYEISEKVNVNWPLIYKDVEELAILYGSYCSSSDKNTIITSDLILNIFSLAEQLSMVCIKKHYMRILQTSIYCFDQNIPL